MNPRTGMVLSTINIFRVGRILLVVAICASAAFLIEYSRSERLRAMRREVWAVHFVAKSFSVLGQDGNRYMSAQQGEVMQDGIAVECSLTDSNFVWSFPRNTDEPFSLQVNGERHTHFFACSGKSDSEGNRVFVVPAPIYGLITSENDVDWVTHVIPPHVLERAGRL